MAPVASWFRSFSNRWFMYLYPLLLLATEAMLRAASGNVTPTTGATSLIGPSLAAAGAAFVVPLAAKGPMTYEKLEKLKKRVIQSVAVGVPPVAAGAQPAAIDDIIRLYQGGYSITSPEEDMVKGICLGAAVVLTGLWLWALWLSLHPSNVSVLFIPIGIVPGLINCFCGLVLAEIREGVK